MNSSKNNFVAGVPTGDKDRTTKYPKLVAEDPSQKRTESVRLEQAVLSTIFSEVVQHTVHEKGVFGFPLLHGLDNFEASFSHPADLLHTVFLGLCKRLMTLHCGGSGKPWHFKINSSDNMKSEC